MKFKKTTTIMMSALALGGLGASLAPSSTSHASTNENSTSLNITQSSENNTFDQKSNGDNLVVTKSNNKFKQLSQEIESLQNQGLDDSKYDEKMQQLLIKYDGASFSLDTAQNRAIQSMKLDGLISSSSQTGMTFWVVNGGLNTYGSSPMALGNLRTLFHDAGTYMQMAGNLIGKSNFDSSMKNLNTGLSLINSVNKWAAPKIYSVGDYYQTMLSKGYREGAVRITVSECFPVSDVFSTTQVML